MDLRRTGRAAACLPIFGALRISRHEAPLSATTAARKRLFTADFEPARAGTVRAAPIQGLAAALQPFGVVPGPLLEAVGLPTTSLRDPENRLDVDKTVRLLALAVERTGCPHLGVMSALEITIDSLGLIGRLACNARDVGCGLRGLLLNLHLNGHAFVPALTVTSGMAELSLRLISDADGNTDPATDLGMAIAGRILSALCGPGWMPAEVSMAHRAPVNRDPYERFFGVPVQFGQDRNAIAFPAALLERRIHGANAAKRKVLERELAMAARRHRLPTATLARRALVACIACGNVSVAAVAASMGLHPRTLNRRLACEGMSVFELLKRERYRLARDLLANTALPVTEIAATLLYSSVGTFSRAFQAVSHESPSRWRIKHGAPRQSP